VLTAGERGEQGREREERGGRTVRGRSRVLGELEREVGCDILSASIEWPVR
jgi:hypothetical protein